MLDFSRIQKAVTPTVNIVPHSPLIEILEDPINIVIPLAVAKNLTVDLETSDSHAPPEFITTDPIRIKQVLVTLLSNAITNSRRGQIKLIASAPDGSISSPLASPLENLNSLF